MNLQFGADGAKAMGSPTFEILISSYNEKYNTNLGTNPESEQIVVIDCTDTLYVPYTSAYNGCTVYWLSSISNTNTQYMWNVYCNGEICGNTCKREDAGIRPVVVLPNNISGTVGTTAEIN